MDAPIVSEPPRRGPARPADAAGRLSGRCPARSRRAPPRGSAVPSTSCRSTGFSGRSPRARSTSPSSRPPRAAPGPVARAARGARAGARRRREGWSVASEIEVPVRLVLAAPRGVAAGDVREIHSQSPVFRQCARLLARLDATPVETHDTALAARRVAELGGPRAAVCSEEAALDAGLVVLEEDVSDVRPNATRFWAVVPGAPGVEPELRTLYFAGARLAAALTEAGAEMLTLPGRPDAPLRGFAVVPLGAPAEGGGSLGPRGRDARLARSDAGPRAPAAPPRAAARDGGPAALVRHDRPVRRRRPAGGR